MVSSRSRAARSPSYPNCDLEEALRKAQVLWHKENRNWAPVTTVQEHWGLKSNTGPALRAVAALKKFGLLVDQGRKGARQARLTDLGISIVIDEREDSQERREKIREAALLPEIHAALWEQYQGNLPSDSTLRYVLQNERRFSPQGADALINEFRSTIAFAKLEDPDSIAAAEDEPTGGSEDVQTDHIGASLGSFEEHPEEHPMVTEIKAASAQTRTLQLPLTGDSWAAIQIPHPMSEPEWDQMMAVLTAMKPGIVSQGRRDAGASDPYESGGAETSTN